MSHPGTPPQCWSQKAHRPHTWGYDEPDPRAPFDCLGLQEGVRFIDKFHRFWNCTVNPYLPCTEGDNLPYHVDCGYAWKAKPLSRDDMERLGRAFDMSRGDIQEFLGQEDSF